MDSHLLSLSDDFRVIDVFEVAHTLGQHPGVTRCASGDLLLVHGDYTDTMEGQTSFVRRCVDDGRTWSEPELIIEAPTPDIATNFTLGIQTLRSGRILLPGSFATNLKKYHFGHCGFVCLYSDDNGRSWQGYRKHDLGLDLFSAYGKIIELGNGEILASGWSRRPGVNKKDFSCYVTRSKDAGKTWGPAELITNKEDPNETDLTLLTDGRVLALMRTAAYSSDHKKLPWVNYAISEDGGRSWSTPAPTNVLGQNLNAWVTSGGTLIAACRGIDGSAQFSQAAITADAPRYTCQKGFGIHFFISEKHDGSSWKYLGTLPDPKGLQYSEYHQAGEPCFCNLPNDKVFVGYYSFDESIFQTLDSRPMPSFVAGETGRIPHVFKRRICACIVEECNDKRVNN